MGTGRHGLGWYLARLRVMGPAEIVHRVGEQAGMRTLQLRYALDRAEKKHQPACAFCTSSRAAVARITLGL